MRHLQLFRILLPIVVLLAATPVVAGVPSPGNSTVPDVLTMVGKGSDGSVDPGYPFTVVVRDFIGIPMPFSVVVLDFSGIPDLWICSDQDDPNVVVNCATNTIAGVTDFDGMVTFHVAGGADNIGRTPGPLGPALRVFAEGVMLRTVRAAAFDQIGFDGLDPNDISSWLSDAFSGEPYARSDYIADGSLDPNDLSAWLRAAFLGASALGCGSAPCPH
jgi:hypothetical protein